MFRPGSAVVVSVLCPWDGVIRARIWSREACPRNSVDDRSGKCFPVRQVRRIRRPRDPRSSFEDLRIAGMAGESVEGVSVRLVADLKATELTTVMLLDVTSDLRSPGRAAVEQAQGVDHFDAGGLREPKQVVDIRRPRDRVLRTIRRSSADAKVLNADRPEQIDEWLVLRAEEISSLFIGQKVCRLKTQSNKISRDSKPRSARINR